MNLYKDFEGFEPANTTPVPDILFDELLPELNEAQLKVMLYIIRRTLGFKKTADAISLRQFRYGIVTKDKRQLDKGCGLKNFTTISKALKSLEAMNCIERATAKTDAGDDDTTVYRIKFRGTTANAVPTTDDVVGYYAKRRRGTTRNVEGVLRETEPQLNSNTRNRLQETVKQDSSFSSENDAPALAFQIQDFPLHFYHDYCIHAQDKGCNDGLTLIIKPLNEVPHDAECDICYKPVHGAHGYFEIGIEQPADNIIDWKKATNGRIPAIQIGEKNDHSSRQHSGVSSREHHDTTGDVQSSRPGAAEAAEQTITSGGSPLAPQDPAQRSGSPSTGSLASTGAVQEAKKPTPKSDTKEVQQRINEHRGYALEEKVDVIRERQAIKSWCNLHELEDYDTVMAQMKLDPYWGKDENYYRIGGVTLLKETPKMLARKRAPLPIQKNTASTPSNGVDHERNKRNLARLEARIEAKGGMKLNYG